MTQRLDRDKAADHSMPALTGLRGLAALWVLIYHAWVYVTPQEIIVNLFDEPIRVHVFISLGWAGVQLLFVLSAFLLTIPYARANAGLSPRPRIFRFLTKRICRVFPAYYLQLLLLFSLTWLITRHLIVDSSNVIAYLLMLFSPPPLGIGAPDQINGVWWTLVIELSFYLALPFIAWLAAWNRKTLLVAASLLLMAGWRYYVLFAVDPAQHGHVWMYQLPGSMDSFGLGMLGAVFHVHYTECGKDAARYKRNLSVLLGFTPIAFIFLGIWMAQEYATYWTRSPILFLWTPIFSATALIVIMNCAQNRPLLNRLLGNAPVFYLGTISYGVYLWHPPIGRQLLNLPLIAQMESYQFPRLLLLMFLCTVAAASISWFLVEARAIALARRVK